MRVTLAINPELSAVIFVDMQNDFGSKDGMFAMAGINISIRNAIAPIARVLAAARRAHIRIVYLKMDFLRNRSGLHNAPTRLSSLIE